MLYDVEQLSTAALTLFESADDTPLTGPVVQSTDERALEELFMAGLIETAAIGASCYEAPLSHDGIAAFRDWMPIGQSTRAAVVAPTFRSAPTAANDEAPLHAQQAASSFG